MQSTGTLSKDLFNQIYALNQSIKRKTRWNKDSLEDCLNDTYVLIQQTNIEYKQKSGLTLEEASREICNGTFGGDFGLFVEHFNSIIFLRKLIAKLDWYSRYGVFPNY